MGLCACITCPGATVRSWMPDRRLRAGRQQENTTIRIYLDDSPEPALAGPARDLFNGTSLIPYPLARPLMAVLLHLRA